MIIQQLADGTGGAVVPDSYFFADTDERDGYFSDHPKELKKDVLCCTESPVALWKWNETEWKDSSTWIRGPKGDAGEVTEAELEKAVETHDGSGSAHGDIRQEIADEKAARQEAVSGRVDKSVFSDSNDALVADMAVAPETGSIAVITKTLKNVDSGNKFDINVHVASEKGTIEGSFSKEDEHNYTLNIEAAKPQAEAEAAQGAIDAHKADTANPHGVTAAQTGLGNVDNTSDADKPVSTAMNTALNAKAYIQNSTAGNTEILIPDWIYDDGAMHNLLVCWCKDEYGGTIYWAQYAIRMWSGESATSWSIWNTKIGGTGNLAFSNGGAKTLKIVPSPLEEDKAFNYSVMWS